jgi:potassium efflux system protein
MPDRTPSKGGPVADDPRSNNQGQPTGDELVEQLEESDQNDSTPNHKLVRHIELYSRFGPVIRSCLHTIIGAIYVPAIIVFVLYQLYPTYDLSLLPGAISRGLAGIVAPLFIGLILSRGLKSDGIAQQHFGWTKELCFGLSQCVDAILWGWLPLRAVYIALETFDSGKWNDSLGRILFIGTMLVMSVSLWYSGRALQAWIKDRESHSRLRFSSLRRMFFWVMPFLPISLAVLSARGFHFAATQMGWRLLWSILFIIGISMVNGFISRLLLITQFGIKLRQLDRTEDGEFKEDASIDIRAISGQVDQLLRATGLVVVVVFGWQLWSNVLPAMNYLDELHMWHSTTNVIDGVKQWVTLRHLLMGIGIAVITVVLSKNLPGLLEITLLDRLPLDRGGRYAISFVLKYLVGIVGFIIACQVIGFSWSNVQWLAAALTVGLGFGLQEIFANIVSGIIILIERPIRVGDVVTVNNVTGTVTRMQLRATTIKDMDFRELIVPNKKFITEDVMNWTLTDRRSRVVHNIGVAYGSDTQLVQETLLKVARRHPLVQKDPAPDVFFKGFGDSTLNFELRVFLPTREIYAKVQHELNMAINDAFKAKGIEIAFPQQDIFIKNISDLPQPNPSGAGPYPGWSTLHPAEGQGESKTDSTATGPSAVDGQESVAGEMDSSNTPNGNANGNANRDVVSDSENLAEKADDSHPPRIIPLPLKQLKAKGRGMNHGVVFGKQSEKAG